MALHQAIAFGLRWQSEAATALLMEQFQPSFSSKAASRFACRRSPKCLRANVILKTRPKPVNPDVLVDEADAHAS